jgi:hypothetical protein
MARAVLVGELVRVRTVALADRHLQRIGYSGQSIPTGQSIPSTLFRA